MRESACLRAYVVRVAQVLSSQCRSRQSGPPLELGRTCCGHVASHTQGVNCSRRQKTRATSDAKVFRSGAKQVNSSISSRSSPRRRLPAPGRRRPLMTAQNWPNSVDRSWPDFDQSLPISARIRPRAQVLSCGRMMRRPPQAPLGFGRTGCVSDKAGHEHRTQWAALPTHSSAALRSADRLRTLGPYFRRPPKGPQ